MESSQPKPISLRVNAEDLDLLQRLQERLGLKPAQLFKLGLRRLMEHEMRAENN